MHGMSHTGDVDHDFATNMRMRHANGWMTGWSGGGIWIWTVVGVLLVVVLVVVISKISKR